MFTTITIKDKDYNCRLTAKACVELEKRLDENPLQVFIKAADGELPKLSEMLTIFHESLKKDNHGIKIEDVYDIYDDYCDDGNTMVDFMQVLIQIFKDSGFMKTEEEESKN